ncbi:MAG: NTP transferase domain-containing protein, partial [Thermoanaerobaculia bacterium]|nr:NTP transferase domain-containing protein [Thermoanaerobaculia bacterium]
MSSTDRPDARIDVAAGLRFHAVVPAAGRGERFGAAKQFVPVAGRPLLAWTVRRLREAGAASITLVLPADDLGDAATPAASATMPSSRSPEASFHCGSPGGKSLPMSPSPAAPRMASHSACSSTS